MEIFLSLSFSLSLSLSLSRSLSLTLSRIIDYNARSSKSYKKDLFSTRWGGVDGWVILRSKQGPTISACVKMDKTKNDKAN